MFHNSRWMAKSGASTGISLPRSGLEFAIIRASYGLVKADPWFEYNWEAARAEGVTVGAYHFFRPSENAKKQAELFVKTVGILRLGNLPPVLDLEEDTQHADPLRGGLRINDYLDAVAR